MRSTARTGAWIGTVSAAVGAAVSLFATLVSYASATGALPSWLYGSANRMSSMRRVEDVPIELMALAWFIAAGAVSARGFRHEGSRAPGYLLLTAVPAAAIGIWSVTGPFWAWPTAVTAGAAIGVLVGASLSSTSPLPTPRRAAADLAAAARSPRARALVLAGLAIFAASAQTLRASVRRVSPEEAGTRAFARWFGVQPRVAALDDSASGAIRVVIFTDYQCPSCQINVPKAHTAIDALRRTTGLTVNVAVEDFPLDPECNPAIGREIHGGACEAAAAVRMVRRDDPAAADDLGIAFYRTGNKLSRESVREHMASRGWGERFDVEYAGFVRQLREETAKAAALGVRATPAVFVNGVRLRSSALVTRALALESARVARGGAAAGAR